MKCAVNKLQPKLLKQWILFCGRKEQFNPKTSHVCMEHFAPDDFENNLQYEMGFTKRRALKRGAVPTIYKESYENKELYEKRAARIQKRENKKIVEALLKEHGAEPVLVTDTRTPTAGVMEPQVIIEELKPDHENLLECKMEPEVIIEEFQPQHEDLLECKKELEHIIEELKPEHENLFDCKMEPEVIIEEFQPQHEDLLECKTEPELIIEDVQQEHEDLLECKKEPLYNDIYSELKGLRKERFDENPMSHIPKHDVTVFGVSTDLIDLNLPTHLDILRYYFYLGERAKTDQKKFSYKSFTIQVQNKLIGIWEKLGLEIMAKNCVSIKLNRLLDKYQYHIKSKKKSPKFREFLKSLETIFHIGTCKCDLKAAPCTCGLVPKRLKEFMHDQHNQRRLTVAAFMMEIEEQGATSMSSMPLYQDPNDSTYAPLSAQEDIVTSASSQYTERCDCFNFALLCDRFGVLKQAKPLIMDKSKDRIEKENCRQEVFRKRLDDSNLLAFPFDGRQDDTLMRDKIDDKHHNRMVKEPLLVILREPNSELMDYVRLEHESAEYKTTKLNDFFNDKNISLDALIGICTDVEPTNTFPYVGIIRRFELLLKRPLHWFVCLLHFNELSFRHLFQALDKSTGKLSRQIETCETLPVVDGFQKMELKNMPPVQEKIEFSTDSKYLYGMAHAISNGMVSVDLANIKPGKIVHSRWLTKAGRLLRLYVTTENPSENLRILVEFIIKCYVPMYFNIKYYSSVVYGSALFFKFISWSRFLQPHLRSIVNKVITDNSYYAHSENILLSMLFDDSKEKRDCAIKKILRYRSDVEDPTELRVYQKPDINFNCTSYTEMINLDDINNVFEPPFTRNIPYDTLKEYLNQDDPPFFDPKIPSHIQGTERHVQLVAS